WLEVWMYQWRRSAAGSRTKFGPDHGNLVQAGRRDGVRYRGLRRVGELPRPLRLQECDALFLRIADLVEDVYYQTDERGGVMQVSLAYEQLWSQEASTIQGRDWFHAVHPEDLARAN